MGFDAATARLFAVETLYVYPWAVTARQIGPLAIAEMGIFLAAALALCGFTYWWLRRRYT